MLQITTAGVENSGYLVNRAKGTMVKDLGREGSVSRIEKMVPLTHLTQN